MKLSNTPQSITRALLIITLGSAAVLAFAYWPETIQAPTTIAPVTQTTGVSVEWLMPDAPTSVQIDCEVISCQETAFTALQKAVAQANISMKYQTYEGLGVLVTDIAGLTNGQDGKYWVYEVNNQKIAVAADAYPLQSGDRLTWKFVIPE